MPENIPEQPPEETPDVEFPIKGADCCPTCKSTKKQSAKVFGQLVKEAKIKPNPEWGYRLMVVTGTVMTTSLVDPRPQMLNIGLSFEVCDDCKTMYVTKTEIVMVPLPAMPFSGKGMPPRMFRPNIG